VSGWSSYDYREQLDFFTFIMWCYFLRSWFKLDLFLADLFCHKYIIFHLFAKNKEWSLGLFLLYTHLQR